MNNTNPLICMIILCGVSGVVSPSGSINTFQSAANSTSQTQPDRKEATILVDHYRAPCVNRFAIQWCYLLATAEKPTEFPYFYGDIEGFKFEWGHEYRLLVVQDEAPQYAASRYSYRLIKILSDKKVGPQRRFTITLKAPTGPPFFNVDESSNIYLFEEVKISIINAKLKARLLQLLKTAGPMDWISGDFKHDQKREDVITLISLLHVKS
jgi:uncharacterized protein DUF4377